MRFDENDIPYVYPSRAHENHRRNDGADSGNDKSNQVGQVIMSIDKKRWKKVIDVFEIKEAKIKRDVDEEDGSHTDFLKPNEIINLILHSKNCVTMPNPEMAKTDITKKSHQTLFSINIIYVTVRLPLHLLD